MLRIFRSGISPLTPFRAVFSLLSIGLVALLPSCGGGSSSTSRGHGGTGSITAVNHIVFMLQENRSFDNYFGQLNGYRTARGLGADVDGLSPSDGNPSFDRSTTIHPFRWNTVCQEQISPGWNESHRQWNRNDPTSSTGAMDGFVYSAANLARARGDNDVEGLRAMGYFDDGHLPFYYFLATQFATSDRFFSSVLSLTPPNRMYSFAATSAGWTRSPTAAVSAKTIWQLLEENNISWKIYADGPTTLGYFQPFGSQHKGNIFPYDQYFKDAKSGNLPAVSFIQNQTGNDEHPTDNVQRGAKFASTFVNALINSPNWKDSVFFLTFDEAGGIYDHVAPPNVPNPDGIAPIDLRPTDTPGNFDRDGFRVPLMVVSPFTKPGYVSHTNADHTAILKFIETRYGLSALTARDAAQPDMTEFFDFTNSPNLNPPKPPTQPVTAPCYESSTP